MRKLAVMMSFVGVVLMGGNTWACPCHDHAQAPDQQPSSEQAVPSSDQAAPACACGDDCKCGCKEGKACECHKEGKACGCGAEGGCGCGK